MELRIGIQQSARDLALEVNETQHAVQALVEKALAEETPLVLTDVKGRTVIVPAAKISFVEFAAQESRRVGFAG